MTIIAVDVGGTNAWFGIAETDKGPLTGVKNLICDDFPRLAGLIPENLFKERFREVGLMSDALEGVPVWLATDTPAGLDGASKALANPNLASRSIAKASSHRPEPDRSASQPKTTRP